MKTTSTASATSSLATLSRRTVLRGAGGLAIVGALAPSFAQAAAAAPGLTGADLEVLRARWVDSLTGRNLIPGSPSTFAEPIATLDRGVTSRLAAVAPTDTQFFADHNWGGAQGTAQSNAMRLNYVDLQTMAVAWATPGSAHEHSAVVLDTVKAGLEHLHTTIYNENTEWWGKLVVVDHRRLPPARRHHGDPAREARPVGHRHLLRVDRPLPAEPRPPAADPPERGHRV